MAKYRPFQPVRFFVEPLSFRPETVDRPSAYRCDECGAVQRLASDPAPCSCGASAVFQFPLRLWDLDEFQLPSDIGGSYFEHDGERYALCFGCRYYECWRREPTRTCGLGLGQAWYWSAGGRLVIRPAHSVCMSC